MITLIKVEKSFLGQYICISSNIAGTDTADTYLRVNDINECRTNIHLCEQTCVNTLGSFRCDCKQGYRLMQDGRSCEGKGISFVV